MATLKEIAEIAHVNVSTVSKALRGSSDLNEQTMANIMRIAQELHYPIRGKTDGRLPQKGNNFIAVIVPEIMSPYYAAMVDSLYHYLKQRDLRMQIILADFSTEEELRCIREVMRQSPSAIVCFTAAKEVPPALHKLISKRNASPFLLVSMAKSDDFCDTVYMDDWQSALIAVRHLLELGHRRIAYIGDSLTYLRREAYETALAAAGIPIRRDYIIELPVRFEECGKVGMERLLSLPERPTAVFAAYDNVAIGVLYAAHNAGLSVPQDLSLIGIDNISAAAYLHPPLTTVTEYTQDVGHLVSDLLFSKLCDGRQYVQVVRLQPTLVQRGSTAPPPDTANE